MPLTSQTPSNVSSTQVTSPDAIRNGGEFRFMLAKDLDDLAYNLNTLQAQVRTLTSNLTSAQTAIVSGFTGSVTVRNSAGTGTSTLVFQNGILTSYTP